ncbi:MAG TPA: outer membrane beta-barrel protein [Moraxellaceae bacterium]
MIKKALLAAMLAVPSFAMADVYFVAGGAFGSTDMADVKGEVYDSNGIPASTDEDFQRAVVGFGVDINRNLAIEATYMTQAEAVVEDDVGAGSSLKFKHSNVQLAAIGKLPLGAQFSLLGKLSANIAPTEAKAVIPPAGYYYDEKGTDVYLGFGLGASFQATDAVGIQVMLERIQLTDVVDEAQLNSNDLDVDQVSVAVKFGF